TRESVQHLLVALRLVDRRIVASVAVVCLLDHPQPNPQFLPSAANLAKQGADHLVAGSRDSDPPPLPHKLRDHATASERLARAGRSLNREHRRLTGERTYESLRGFREPPVLADQRVHIA